MSIQPSSTDPRRRAVGDPARPTSLVDTAAAVVALVLGGVAAIAIVCRLFFSSAARGWLGFGFHPPPATVDTALETLRTNVGLASLALVAALALSLLAEAAPVLGTFGRALLWFARGAFDLVLASLVALNVCVVGLALGAYGLRMLVVLLPHGPLELAAFSIALAAYWVARREGLALGPLLAVWALTVGTLVVAAGLETGGA